jgi:lipooligosaccharide transport system permease protein
MMGDSAWAIRCVWLRYLAVFRKSVFYGVVTTFIEPALYLISFGYGMGTLVGDIHVQGVTVSYRQFIFAGIVGQTVLFQGFFEAAYGSFIRMYYQKIFHAMATTPITLSEVLWGELLWDAAKGSFAASAVLLLGCLTGDFKPWGAIAALPLAFLCAFLFAGMGLWVAAASKTIEQISYPQYLLVFPMFLFCGVFYPLEALPTALQNFAWILPLTSVNSLMRTLLLGFPFQWPAIPILLVWLVLLVLGSRRFMTRRLIK